MMVETMLESSQDFGMSNGSLPQWKRELLQRRAARSRPAPPPAPPAPPPPPPPTDDEELRYGPGIVKRLKSRYLSLALRDAPRRRPSVLRRAASLEHLLDEPPPPRPRPVSLAVPPTPPRRDSVKRARSVDALSRLDEPDAAPRCRPPRRPAPLLRDTERPPPDVVRAALRKFESAPPRRAAPAARVSAVLRGLEGPRSSTPEPRARSPSPAAADLSAIDEPEGAAISSKPVSRAALEGIARAGSTIRYAFESPKNGSHLPTVAAANPVLLSRARLWTSPRRVGIIRPMPAPSSERNDASATPHHEECIEKPAEEPRVASPTPDPETRGDKREPPSAVVEPILRSPPSEIVPTETTGLPSPKPIPPPRERTPDPIETKSEPRVMETIPKPALMNGHAEGGRTPEPRARTPSRIGAAGIERAWTGAKAKKTGEVEEKKETEVKPATWGRKPRPPAPASTSVVFNFSNRKEVPDYIENDGVIRRASRRHRIKAGEPGVVVLRPAAGGPSEDSGSESEGEAERPPSPCSVRFVNDNVLINGRSSMRPDRQRIAKLKLQFDDSLTRTFEYPSETSLCEDSPQDAPSPSPSLAPSLSPSAPSAPSAPAASTLAANTHLASGALGRYTPSKTHADDFQLGLARPRTDGALEQNKAEVEASGAEVEAEAGGAEAEAEAGGQEDVRPCAADLAHSWSDARALSTDLLF
ncbi:serine/arginine repetitive matrix protein 1 [Papilio machaon]|uniref:serine/arginine repetitive matrix protein 1 n=1 Tax=Papilio machaon TaxID=76193 RepID=UPI001E6651FB|nr:serine/arginine repetitive matrix protein 1 [Papilio machaon]